MDGLDRILDWCTAVQWDVDDADWEAEWTLDDTEGVRGAACAAVDDVKETLIELIRVFPCTISNWLVEPCPAK